MKIEEYGKGNPKTIVMLHGAYFVHSFGRQYSLSKKYHIIVPHIMGFGEHTEKVFTKDECIEELVQYIKGLNKKVTLIGFSLGAQLAFQLVSQYEEMFESAIVVSPWLVKNEEVLSEALEMNKKQLKSLKNKFKCGLIGMMNGLPPKACKEFVAQMQRVKEETVHNVVYNGITLESVPEFSNVTIPVIVLAGEKEQREIHLSVQKMSEMNPNCKVEIWAKANHNIPPVFAKKFNELICSVV